MLLGPLVRTLPYIRPKLAGPRRQFELKLAEGLPKKHPALSEWAMVLDILEDGSQKLHPAPFMFSPEFVSFIGHVLPMGIGPHRQGMVTAIRRWPNDEWEIMASYTDMRYPSLLWREPTPLWLGIGESKNGVEKKNKSRTGE